MGVCHPYSRLKPLLQLGSEGQLNILGLAETCRSGWRTGRASVAKQVNCERTCQY